MLLRKLLLPLMLGVLGTAPAVAAPRAAVKPALKAKKSAGSPSTVQTKTTPPKKKRARLTRGRRVARRAAALVGVPLRSQPKVPDDCSGLVRLAYQSVGIELLSHGTLPGENAVSAMYRRAQRAGALHRRTPRPGDLIFFRETYDRNRDGERNDGLTHVAVIEAVEKDGTVVFVHRGGSGVKRSRMNLRLPAKHRVEGRILNDYLRRAEGEQRARLTSELFSGYASVSRL
jgi:cell wall-associated NlpC family hydrolase